MSALPWTKGSSEHLPDNLPNVFSFSFFYTKGQSRGLTVSEIEGQQEMTQEIGSTGLKVPY